MEARVAARPSLESRHLGQQVQEKSMFVRRGTPEAVETQWTVHVRRCMCDDVCATTTGECKRTVKVYGIFTLMRAKVNRSLVFL